MANPTLFSIEDFLVSLAPTKRSVFVSYHHGGDQAYYDYFANVFGATYRMIRDRSLRSEVWSDDSEYVMRRIREDYLTSSWPRQHPGTDRASGPISTARLSAIGSLRQS